MHDSPTPSHFASSAPLPASVFVGRDEQIATFRHRLEADEGALNRVIVFHGAAGSGKSMLLRALHTGLQEITPSIPHAWFNLHNVNDRPQAYREVLTGWRGTLQNDFGLRFPRFDLCLALLLVREADNTSPYFTWCPALLPLYELAKKLLASPENAVELLQQNAGAVALVTSAGFWTTPGDDGLPAIRSLCQRVAAYDSAVAIELVDYFASDLIEGLWGRAGKAINGVLFLDSYESLWPGEQVLVPETAHHMDWWLRELAAFFLVHGVQLVIGAREPLRWAQYDDDWQAADLDQQEIGGVTPTQAQDFLARCGIGPGHPEAPSSLQRAIIRSSSPAGSGGFLNQWTNRQLGESLPLWLALCADTVQNFRLSGKPDPGAASFALVSAAEPGKKLCDLLLKSFPDQQTADWLAAVALTPRCDEAAALAAGYEFRKHNWERFTQFSFVEDQGNGFWRIQPAVRHELLAERRRHEKLEAHLNYTHHWTERGEPAPAWFHKWALDPSGALDEWTKMHAEALKNGVSSPAEMARARSFLSWWGEIALDERDLEHVEEKVWAHTHVTLAQAFRDTPFLLRAPALALALTHLEAALSVFTSDEHPHEWAKIQIVMGNVQRALAGECAAEGVKNACLNAAIERYRGALHVFTPTAAPREWAEIQIEMAATHRDQLIADVNGRGLYDYLSRSIDCYEQAMRLYDQKRHPRQWARIQKEMGETFASATNGGRARNLERAITCFNNALTVLTEQDTPEEWAALMCARGKAYTEYPDGDQSENLREALSCLLGALRIYTEEAWPVQWAETNLQTGLAWGDLGYVSDDHGAFRSAVNYISTAAKAFERIGRLGDAAQAKELVIDINKSLERAT